jgi:hypothetical protein
MKAIHLSVYRCKPEGKTYFWDVIAAEHNNFVFRILKQVYVAEPEVRAHLTQSISNFSSFFRLISDYVSGNSYFDLMNIHLSFLYPNKSLLGS